PTACGRTGTWSTSGRYARALHRSARPSGRHCARSRNYRWPSSIHLTKHKVIGTDHRNDVGEHVPAHDLVHRREVGEARSAQVHAERLVGAVGNQVATELALGRL